MRVCLSVCLVRMVATLVVASASRGVATTATPTQVVVGDCVGDCNGDRVVTINELITGVNVALNGDSTNACPALDCNTGPPVYINCLTEAVNNALTGCGQPPPTPVAPHLALNLQINDLPDQHQIDIVATLDHLGGSIVSYSGGCAGRCYPQFLQPIAIDLTGREGPVIVENCGPPSYCPETLMHLSPGQSVQQTVSVTGVAFEQHCDSDSGDAGCTMTQLTPGPYAVTATFSYRIGSDWSGHEYALQERTEFNWPGATTPSETPPPSATECAPCTTPTPTPTITVILYCGERENVGGCCDFGGQRSCYPLVFGSDSAKCFHTDGGYPHGCTDFPVLCNETTGLCEEPSPTPPGVTPTPPCVPTSAIPPYCATHCRPCPTIRAGCNAQACGRCIDNPVCTSDEVCVPLKHGFEGCCSCESVIGYGRM